MGVIKAMAIKSYGVKEVYEKVIYEEEWGRENILREMIREEFLFRSQMKNGYLFVHNVKDWRGRDLLLGDLNR